MRKIAYFDCPTGIAGDMCLGSLISCGVPLDYLTSQLNRLGISHEYHLRAELVKRNGQQATKVYVDLTSHSHTHPHSHTRHLGEIEQMITSAQLPERVEAWSLAVFRQLAVAEGFVHGISPQQVHFHEVGAIDAIVDIVGTCLGLDWLGIDGLYCSALPTGGGTVKAAHGEMSVPTPAVLKLMEMANMPVYSNQINKELVTPTGAAIVSALAEGFGSPPKMTLAKIGLGAGSAELPMANILRLWIGEATSLNSSTTLEKICLLETQIDDLNPQVFSYLFEALLGAGALDVFTQPIGMKKSRPGCLLTVVCLLEKQSICEQIIFQETTTLGIRRSLQERVVLAREIIEIISPWGSVRVKVATNPDGRQKAYPEYEDCVRLAQSNHLPWQEIHHHVLQTWYQKKS